MNENTHTSSWTADTSGYPGAVVSASALEQNPPPIQIVSAHVTVGGRTYSANDIPGAQIRPGDIITWTAHDDHLTLGVERVKPWWRRWPWARTERHVLGEVPVAGGPQ